jgi:IS1 family transposase
MDRLTREIIGVYVGDRSKESAKQLWKTLPPVYRSGCCSTPNVRLFTQINGKHIRECYLANVTV